MKNKFHQKAEIRTTTKTHKQKNRCFCVKKDWGLFLFLIVIRSSHCSTDFTWRSELLRFAAVSHRSIRCSQGTPIHPLSWLPLRRSTGQISLHTFVCTSNLSALGLAHSLAILFSATKLDSSNWEWPFGPQWDFTSWSSKLSMQSLFGVLYCSLRGQPGSYKRNRVLASVRNVVEWRGRGREEPIPFFLWPY